MRPKQKSSTATYTSKSRSKKLKRSIDRDIFGGMTLRNTRAGVEFASGGTHAKRKRPIQNGEWLHVCLKSGIARGSKSMLKPGTKQKVDAIVKRSVKNSDVRISRWQNVGNHLHFSVKAPTRKAYNRWIRSVSGLIARTVLGAERGRVKTSLKTSSTTPLQTSDTSSRTKFWESRPFTRIIRGFEAMERLRRYIKKNELEASGFTTARAKEIVRQIAAHDMYLDQTAPIDISRLPTW